LSDCQSYEERTAAPLRKKVMCKSQCKSTRVVVLAFSKTLGDSSVFKAAMIEEKADSMHYVYLIT
jgi:hypothetical protein